jgi:acetylornithine aminotransferase
VTLTQKHGGLGWAPGTSPAPSSSSSGGAKVFFSSTGTEANEAALKVARSVGKHRWAAAAPGRVLFSAECTKSRIACFENAFHGRTMGALSVTINPKYQKPFEPLLPGVDVGKLNDLSGLERLVGEDTCAVIVEPVQGEGGIHVAEVEWLRALRKRCDQVGAVLIFDEIQVSRAMICTERAPL